MKFTGGNMFEAKSGFVKLEIEEHKDDLRYIFDLLLLEALALGKMKQTYPFTSDDHNLKEKYTDEFIAISKELNPKMCATFLKEKAIRCWLDKEDYYGYVKLLDDWYPDEYNKFKDELALSIQMLARKREL